MSQLEPSIREALVDQSTMILRPKRDTETPQREDKTPLTEPVRPHDDTDDRGRQDEAELPGEGGTYDRD